MSRQLVSRHGWDAAFENQVFNQVIAVAAPHLPDRHDGDTREPHSAEEIAEVVEFTARLAAHDTFIVQAVSKAFGRIDFDTNFQLKLARQVGDDGHHAELARHRLHTLTGSDQLPLIERYIVDWVELQLANLPDDAERRRWVAQVIAADDDMQQRLNPYLRHRIANAGRAWQSDLTNVVDIYDGYRRRVLAHLLDTPDAELPALTSLAA